MRPRPLLVADVARKLGVSVSRVVALDDRLQPERTPAGVRVYREDAIDRVVEERQQQKEHKQGAQ